MCTYQNSDSEIVRICTSTVFSKYKNISDIYHSGSLKILVRKAICAVFTCPTIFYPHNSRFTRKKEMLVTINILARKYK